MKVEKNNNITITGDNYQLVYEPSKPGYVDLKFNSGIGAELFAASGCDRDDRIDQLIEIAEPEIINSDDQIIIRFIAKTTLWERTEYNFTCLPEKVLYGYKVTGEGSLDNARFFEGFLKDDPRMKEAYYPYFCGPGRHLSYHRPVKYFMQSSKPDFNMVHTFAINSSDKRWFMYYENTMIRVNADRLYEGGDWLVTPPPFLYLLSNKDRKSTVSMGLVVMPGDNRFLQYEYCGGEVFGLNLNYDGFTKVKGTWESPSILFEQNGEDVYEALSKYTRFLQENKYVAVKDRSNMPLWWHKPIFGGWGEQVFHSNRWDEYYGQKSNNWDNDNVHLYCTQKAYNEMLATLESKGVEPTILIVDNRWFVADRELDVDEVLWPDMKGFVEEQHKKGRKVILWVSPWSYCHSATGMDVPLDEQMVLDENAAYTLEIDTDVFYPNCKREMKKVRKELNLPKATLAEPNWKFFADPQNPNYEKRVREKITYLLSPEGLNADGFEFDYTHFLPMHRGLTPIQQHEEMTYGTELLHRIVSIYYDQAKKAKSDALIISHTYNPYFNDVVDMLRLQDIYTDRASVVPQMTHRANIAKAVCPGCAIHTDQHPMPSLAAWREYARYQPLLGNPCLYYVSGIETTRERFDDTDFAMLKEVWTDYNKKLEKK